jgi:hypothetical protein
MTLHRMWMALTVGAATVALLAMSPAPALADEGRFRDARFDTAHPADITSVRVEHGKRIVVVIHHRNLTFRSMADAPHMVRVAFDVGPRYDGPEFYVRVHYQADQPADLRPAQGWGTMHNPPLPSCSGEHVSVSALRNITRFSIPRSCFGDPRHIRVHVRVSPWHQADGNVDVAPAARTMGPWVPR